MHEQEHVQLTNDASPVYDIIVRITTVSHKMSVRCLTESSYVGAT